MSRWNFHRLRPSCNVLVQTFWGREIYIEETMPQLIYYSNEGCVAKSHFPSRYIAPYEAEEGAKKDFGTKVHTP